MATSSSEDCSVILACVDMNHFKYNTDGLGGHFGLTCSLELGVARGVTKHRFHLLFFSMIVMCMGSPMSLQIPLHSLILNIQRSNELYKNIKFPYIRRLINPPKHFLQQFTCTSSNSSYIRLDLMGIYVDSSKR